MKSFPLRGCASIILIPFVITASLLCGSNLVVAGTPPPRAINPQPRHNAIHVPINTNLNWNGAAGVYVEDFNDSVAQGWNEYTCAEWAVVSNEYRAQAGTIGRRMQSVYIYENWQNCTAQVTMRRTGFGDDAAVLVLRASDDFNWKNETGSAYLIGISGNGWYYIARYAAGSFAWLQAWTNSPYLNTGSAPNTVRVAAENMVVTDVVTNETGASTNVYISVNFDIYFNSTWVISGADTNALNITNSGYVALLGFSGGPDGETVHYFDDVIVNDPVASKRGFSAEQQAWYNAQALQGATPDRAPAGARAPEYIGAKDTVMPLAEPAHVESMADPATSYNVYFGTNPTPDECEFKGNQPGTTYAPGTLTPNIDYYWRIDALNEFGTTTVTNYWHFRTSSPVNDNFANATPLIGNAGTVYGNNVNATVEAGEPTHAGHRPCKSVWYQLIPSAGGMLSLDTLGSSFNAILAIYTGDALDNLTPVAADATDGATGRLTDVPLNAGVTYWIVVASFSDAACGNLTLTWRLTPNMPDLVVESMTHTPEPATTGGVVAFTVRVKNAGTAAVPAGQWFRLGFYQNRATAPVITNVADEIFDDNAGLAVNASRDYQFAATAAQTGTFTAWAYVDSYNGSGDVAEVDEGNNTGPSGGHPWSVLDIPLPAKPINPYPRHNVFNAPITTNLSWNGVRNVYVEDFNDGVAQGWIAYTNAAWSVVSNEYRAQAGTTGRRMQSTYVDDNWQNCMAQMTVRRTGFGDDAAVLVLRASSDFNWENETGSAYLMGISGNGWYYIAKYDNGVFGWIQEWTRSAYLNTGRAPNTVGVAIEGAALDVYFNGYLAASTNDSSVVNSGYVALLGYSGGLDGETVYYFDEVSVGDPVMSKRGFSAEQAWNNTHSLQGGTPDRAPAGARAPEYTGARDAVPMLAAPARVENMADPATSYDVYFGTDPTPDETEFKGNQPGTKYAPGTLNLGVTYYWRIDAKNARGITTGDVWQFSTVQYGSLQLFIEPEGARTAGAQWNMDSGVWRESGTTISNLPVGSHTVSFSAITNWDKPADLPVQIVNDQNTINTGTYIQHVGSLQMFITPEDACAAGAQWCVDGGVWQDSGAVVSNLPVGLYVVAFRGIANWGKPADLPVQIAKDQTTSTTGTYVHISVLQVFIEPAGARVAGARWRVDGGTWQASGAAVGNLSVGSHTVAFSAVTNWDKPADQQVATTKDQTTTATVAYIQHVGSLRVTIEPAGARTAGAQWCVDGGTWQVDGAAVSNLSVGSHTVSFSDVVNWAKPANLPVQIANNQMTTATVVYIQHVGSLWVLIEPADARAAGAQWRVDDGVLQDSGAVVSNLAVGSHMVAFSAISNWVEPAELPVQIANNQTTTDVVMYVQHVGSLQVLIEPEGARTAGAQWNIDGGAWQDGGVTLSNLLVKSHTVAFKDVSNWQTPATATVVILHDQTTSTSATYWAYSIGWLVKYMPKTIPTKTVVYSPKTGVNPDLKPYFLQGYEISILDVQGSVLDGPHPMIPINKQKTRWKYPKTQATDKIVLVNYLQDQKKGRHKLNYTVKKVIVSPFYIVVRPAGAAVAITPSLAPLIILLEPEHVRNAGSVIELLPTVLDKAPWLDDPVSGDWY